MNKKLQQKLFRKYPVIFEERKLTGDITRMCDGITCGDGWYNIIEEACRQIDLLNRWFKIKITYFQVKEKFAALRIYTNRPTIESNCGLTLKETKTIEILIHSITSNALNISVHTCDVCGNYRSKSKALGPWIYAMCDDCWKKFLKEKKIKQDPTGQNEL